MLIHRIHKFPYSAGRNVLLNLKFKPCNSEWTSEACLSEQLFKLLNKMFGKYVVNENIICLSAHWQKFPPNFFFPLKICLFCLENGHYLMYCWKRLSAPLFLTHYSEFPYTPKYIIYTAGKFIKLSYSEIFRIN